MDSRGDFLGHDYKSIREEIMGWWEVNKRDLPWRDNPTPYESFIAEIFLRQTRVVVVERVFPIFIEIYPDFEKILEADIKEMKDIMEPLGILRRAEELKSAARFVEAEFNGDIPPEKESLKNIPGVGEYTASAIMVFGFNLEGMLIDTNIKRIIMRIFGADEQEHIRQHVGLLKQGVEDSNFFSALLDFGAKVCRAPEPVCNRCPILDYCSYPV